VREGRDVQQEVGREDAGAQRYRQQQAHVLHLGVSKQESMTGTGASLYIITIIIDKGRDVEGRGEVWHNVSLSDAVFD
jgi:hypothetical protein